MVIVHRKYFIAALSVTMRLLLAMNNVALRPETKMSERLKEVAERIARGWASIEIMADERDLAGEIEAALKTEYERGYEEGTNEIIVNAQVEYLRGQREERERAAKVAVETQQHYEAMETVSNDDGDRGGAEAAKFIATAIREGEK